MLFKTQLKYLNLIKNQLSFIWKMLEFSMDTQLNYIFDFQTQEQVFIFLKLKYVKIKVHKTIFKIKQPSKN